MELQSSALDWVSPKDYPARHSDYMNRREEGTGEYFVRSSQFENWVRGPDTTLLCLGIPGAGKTMLATIAIDHLLGLMQHESMIGVAFVYCSFQDPFDTATEVLAAILKQLVQISTAFLGTIGPGMIEQLYRQHLDRKSRPSFKEIFEALYYVCSSFQTVYIVVDALDECQDSNGTRSQLLAGLQDLQEEREVRLMFTSRYIPEIMSRLKGAPTIELRASDDDVSKFVTGQAHRLPESVQRDHELLEMIRNEIVGSADGMFLLARSHMDSLLDKRSRKAIILALSRISKDATSLDYAYDEALKLVQGQQRSLRELAKMVLSWTAYAQRPLSVLELQHALAVEVGESELDLENISDVEVLLSVCAGLVIVNESNIIRFAHYTMQPYMKQALKDWFPDAEASIAETCVAYLSFSAFTTGICLSDEELEARLQSLCLYGYAACHWGHHARELAVISQGMIDFLEHEQKVEAAAQALLVEQELPRSAGYSQRIPRQITGVHLSAYCGLDKAVVALIDRGHPPNVADSNGQTPLWWSAKEGHEAVTKLLSQKDTVTLQLLIQRGEHSLVKHLLNAGYNANTPNFRKRTPLHDAVASGNANVANDLVDAGADLNAKDINQVTPLLLALDLKHTDMIRLLLRKSVSTVDITATLWRRAFGNYPEILKIAEKRGGGRTLELVPRTCLPLVTAALGTERYLMQLVGDASMLRWSVDRINQRPRPYALRVSSEEVDEQRWAYCFTIYLPAEPGFAPDTMKILWSVVWDANSDGTGSWRTMDHISTLPYIWIPNHGIEFVQHFMVELEQKWISLCNRLQITMSSSRRNVLRQKGSDTRLLENLLEDGQRWIDLRDKLHEQVEEASRSAVKYSNRHSDTGALDTFQQRMKSFSDNIGRKIDKLDDASKGLIQMEFNLVSINEARRSTSASTSMKRLSWITFVFLPLVFISGLFGMNIDILETNPPWWLYILVASATMLITSIVWIIFKRNPNLEQRIEQKFAWLVKP